MRDDTARWDAPASFNLKTTDFAIEEIILPTQFWISGTEVLTRFTDHLIAWPDIVSTETYALSLRRDRVLWVGDTDLTEGFSDALGLAVSNMSGGFRVFDLSGPRAFEILCHGAELRLDRPSQSVMRRAFGADLMLYRAHEDTRFRLHIPRAETQAVMRLISTHI